MVLLLPAASNCAVYSSRVLHSVSKLKRCVEAAFRSRPPHRRRRNLFAPLNAVVSVPSSILGEYTPRINGLFSLLETKLPNLEFCGNGKDKKKEEETGLFSLL